ncbi:MAG: hypothetical protein JW910_10045 [Anaerolineae bacterium]|nr:hypothetical protein [Anaerolineae bacterium]
MTHQPDDPGPGERTGPDLLQTEADARPIPDGEMRGADVPRDPRRRTQEMLPVSGVEADGQPRLGQEGSLRRTGTERDALAAVRKGASATERRVDHSAADDRREDIFDPAQDDSGSQPDQG